jgi:hypothetical protein
VIPDKNMNLKELFVLTFCIVKLVTSFELTSSPPTFSITKVFPLEVTNNGVVSVSFQSQTPTSGDFIAGFSPADADTKTTAPIVYGNCKTASGYLTTGVGQLNFQFTVYLRLRNASILIIEFS